MEQGTYNLQLFSLETAVRSDVKSKGTLPSAATLLMKNILVSIACCCGLIQHVGTIWVTPLQMSNAVGSPNAMDDPVGYSIRYFDLTSLGGGPVVFALGNGASKQIKAFDQTGTFLGSITASELPLVVSAASVTVALAGKPRLFVSVGQTLYTYDITMGPSGTYTLTYSSEFNFQSLWNPVSTVFHYFSFLDYVKPGTDYLYLLARYQVIGYRDYVRVSRLLLASDDISVSPGTRFATSGGWDACPLPTSPVVYENSFQLDHLDSNTGITNCGANLILFSSVNGNFPVLKILLNAGAASYFKLDNLDLQVLYMSVFLPPTAPRLDSVDLALFSSTASGASMPLKFTSLTTVPYARGGMLNFGKFPYLGVIGRSATNAAELRLVNKFTFTLEALSSPSNFVHVLSGEAVMDLGATEAFQTSDIEFNFAFSSAAPNNGIFFHKVIFELCTDRDPVTKVCSKCSGNTYLQNTSQNNICIRFQDIPSGWGVKTSDNDYIEPCTNPSCKSCRSDSTACTDSPCDISQGYVIGSAASVALFPVGTCVLRSTLANGYGADTTTNEVKPCADSNCDVCRDDITSCNFCKPGFFLDETNPARVCTDINTIADPTGRDPTSTARFPCMPGCLACKGTPVECTLCDNPANYYLDTVRKTCILISDIPPKFGPQISSGEVAACLDPNCLSCPQSTLVCAKCDMSLGFFLDTSAGVCKTPSSAPAQKGADYSSGTFQSCSVGCVECTFDFTACMKCDQTLGWYRDTKLFKCLQKSDFASGEGADNASGDIRRCSDPGCINCNNDFKICNQCEVILFLNTTTRECQPMTLLSVSSVQFIKSSLKAFVVFKEKIMTKDYLSLVDITLLDGNGAVFTDYSNLAITQINSGDTLLITMNFTGTIVNGKILIKNKQNTDFAFETDNGVAFPLSATITIPNVVFSADSAKLAGSVEAGGAVVKSFSSTVKIILVGVSPAASVVLDKIGAYFSYLQYLDGPTVVFPDLVLSMLSGGDILPWAFPPNLFVPWATSDCTPKPRYLEQEADCNIMVNYGPKLIVIATIIVFSGLLLLLRFPIKLCLACKRKSLQTRQLDQSGADQSDQPTKQRQTDAFDLQTAHTIQVEDPLLQDPCFRFFLRFQLNYGFKYLMVFMEGVCLEACGYAVINLFNVDRSPQQVVGGSISAAILLYYAYYGYMVTEYVSAMNRVKRKDRRFHSRRARMQRALARRHDTDLLDAQPASPADEDDLAEPVKETSPVLRILEGHRYSLVDYTVDEYKPHLAREWYYFTPVFVVAKNLLLQLLAYLLSGSGYTQIAAVALVEALCGAYAIASRVNEKPVENFLEAMNSVLYVVYLLLKAVTLSESLQEETRQKSLGYPMAAILVTIVLVNVVFISVVAMKELWFRGKLLYKRWKKSKQVKADAELARQYDNVVINKDKSNNLQKQDSLPKLGKAIEHGYDILKANTKPSTKLDKHSTVTKIGVSALAASAISSQQTQVARSVLKPNKHNLRTLARS